MKSAVPLHPIAWIEMVAVYASSLDDCLELPCSLAQERFWLLDRLEPGNPAYNLAVRWQLEGRVSIPLLERAWLLITERHEALRTIFVEVDGKPMQRVLRRCFSRIAEIDLTALAEQSRQAECDRIGAIEARAPFDLGSGPPLRATLVRLAPTRSVLCVTTHQIVCDGASIAIMARELGVIHEALSRGEPPALPQLAAQYRDFARSQLERLEARGTNAEDAYWMRQLEGLKPFRVPPDRPRPAAPTASDAIASVALPRDLMSSAQALSAARGATLLAGALAALIATLARYTGEDEIVLGTPISVRNRIELEPLIGQFVSSLVLRARLDDDPSFGELIDRLHVLVAEALEHRHIPNERLLELLRAERSPTARGPVPIEFIYEPDCAPNARGDVLRLLEAPSPPLDTTHDLRFRLIERPDGWRLSCQYDTDRFDGDTARRLLRYCRIVLESGIERPELRVSELPLGGEAECERLLARLNDTAVAYPRNHTLTQAFAEHATAMPESIAIQFGTTRLTYRQLDERAGQLADELLRHGARPGERVAIQLERCVEYAVAVLAVLRVGAAVVPIDPEDLLSGARARIEACNASCLISTRGRWARAARFVPILEIESVNARDGGVLSRLAPAAASGADAPALILTDAAVAISHRTLLNLQCTLRRSVGLCEQDIWVSTSPIGSHWAPLEILLPLVSGAQLVLATSEEALKGRALRRLLRRCGATLMHADSSTLSRLVDCGWDGVLINALCSGGAPTRQVAQRLQQHGTLWLLEGWPEAGVWSAIERVHEESAWLPADTRSDTSITRLGAPVANSRFRILDRTGRPCAIGAAGELHVEGDCLFAGGTFRTGEIVRLKPDGAIERLARTAQREREPARPAPAPDARARERKHRSTAPCLQTERRLAAIWSSMLGLAEIDPTAGFFELGGNLLLAARMLARVEREFGRRITLATLFRDPTVRGLGQALGAAAREFDFRQVVRLRENGSLPPLIAINNTGIYDPLARRLGPEQPVFSLQLFDPSVRSTVLPERLEDLASEYAKLIRRVQPRGPYALVGWYAAGPLSFEIARQLAESNAGVAQLFLMDAWVPDYFARLPRLEFAAAVYALRWLLVLTEWRKVLDGSQPLTAFLGRRLTVQRLRAALAIAHEALARSRGAASEAPLRAAAGPAFAAEGAHAEQYDEWLLQYLALTAQKYTPKPYPGRIVLYRSSEDPTLRLFDPQCGWGAYAAGGVEVVHVKGDRYTMFQDPGVEQIAEHMRSTLARAQERPIPS